MKAKFLKIVMLAAVSDGEIQPAELEMLNQIKRQHPEFKSVSDDDGREAMADIYNKLSAGMETKHIVEQLSSEFSNKEKQSAFALAKEICAADFDIKPAETDFLKLLEKEWKIPKSIISAVDQSISLRYTGD